ncbi:hypothetical protein LSAT2_019519 [Lamellibrachia satsuma]|nr:hypothetical protein LSAT2_019519 [Lamellibrachia satsuma]
MKHGTNRKTEAEIKREWDHLVQDDNDPCFNDLESGILNSSHIKAKLEEDDIYGQLDDDNEAAVVDSILQKMLSKEVVSQAVIQDLGVCHSQKKQIDPRTKMQMRHMQGIG